MVHDNITIVKMLQAELRNNELIQKLRPIYNIMGSVSEGTRMLLGNEADIVMDFKAFNSEAPPFKVTEDDPFHLTSTDDYPDWLKQYEYLDEKGRFIFHKFLGDLLRVVTSSVDAIFDGNQNTTRLRLKTKNTQFERLDCKACRKIKEEGVEKLLKHCLNCMVAVSQSKVGIVLQFLWTSDEGEEIYCSIDLVPTFKVRKIDPLELARFLNTAMLKERPEGWFTYLKKYVKANRIVTELLECVSSDSQMIGSVRLKNLNCSKDCNYFVQLGQCLTKEKFKSNMHKTAYMQIKALKKILDIEFNNYLLKKLLLRPVEFDHSFEEHFLFDVMCQPELRETFEKRIDYTKWMERANRFKLMGQINSSIPLKNESQ
jgi:hypothetical protein